MDDRGYVTYRRIPDYEMYMASSDGDIFSIKGMDFLRQGWTRRGYREVKLSKKGIAKTKLVHRLISSAFNGQSKKTVDHINFDKSDNRIRNLRYISAIDNHKIACDSGRIKSGCDHYSSALGERDILSIRASQDTNASLSKKYNVADSIISRIRNYKSYRSVK